MVGAEKVVKQIEQDGGYDPLLSHGTCFTLSSSRAIYHKCNVAAWDEQVELFELAMSTYGSVDVVVRTFDWLIIHNVDTLGRSPTLA